MKKPLSRLMGLLAIVAVAAMVFTPMGCPTPAATVGQAGPLGVVALDITQTTATITWNTDVEATSQVQYGKTTGYGLITPFDEALVTSHSVTLGGLSPGTTYHFRVIFEDASGNLFRSSDFTFAALPPEALPYEGTIAFVSDRDGNEEIYIMNADGTGLTRFTWNVGADENPAMTFDAPFGHDANLVAWSAFCKQPSKATFRNAMSIFTKDIEGSTKTNVSNSTSPDRFPSWTKDADRIVYSSAMIFNSALFVVDADGGNKVQLTKYPGKEDYGANDFDPAISPDGTKIVYVSSWDPDPGDGVQDIDPEICLLEDESPDPVVPVGGPWFTNKYNVAGVVYTKTYLTDNTFIDESPAWSSDGTKILFASNRDGDMEIYVMDADGTNVTKLTDNAASDSYPCWSPDDKHIAFVSQRDGNAEIYVMKADGSEQTRITNNPAHDGAPTWGEASLNL